MRYHKAIEVTKPEADFIKATAIASLTDIVVISRGGKFYDVRALSCAELEAFLADLARAEITDEEAELRLPN